MNEVIHVFRDTNVALHFRRADEIDWGTLAGAPQVVLVVAPIFLRELERQKIHNPSRKLRERADRAVKWFASFLQDGLTATLRPDVTLKFLDRDPQLDFGAHGLSRFVEDDWLIASALEYQIKTEDPVVVGTADSPLQAKLYTRSPLRPLVLPDDLRLPAEPDPMEKELRDTQRKLQRLESRLPDLRLTFESQTDRLQLSLPALGNAPSAPTLREIQALHSPVDTASVYLADTRMREDYNRELPEFYDAYSAYLEQLGAWEEQHARTVKVELVLSNRGSAPASDIDAVLHLPDDLELFANAKELLKRPDPPRPPRRPSAGFRSEIPMPNLLDPGLLDPIYRGVYVDRNKVGFPVDRLKQGFDEELEPFYFRFPDRSAIRSFSIDFELSAGELPEATTGQLHFVVTTG